MEKLEEMSEKSDNSKPEIEVLCYNNNYKFNGILYTRNVILRLMCGIYLIAFLSFYYQSSGLFGENGILPAAIFMESKQHTSRLNMLHYVAYLGLNSEHSIDLVALLGTTLSFVCFLYPRYCLLPTFLVLWILYFSLVQIAQQFVNQSDYLLLEAGFLLLILAPLQHLERPHPTDRIGMLMIRWLLFRFLFGSGVVKIFSKCPHWWNFTAMGRHFEVMPLPTPLSWYSHNLPPTWLKLTNIHTNITELLLPWMFFFPHDQFRVVTFYWQIFLQINIIFTGNYGFLNFLMPVLLLSLLTDNFFIDESGKPNIKNCLYGMLRIMILSTIGFFLLCYIFAGFFTNWSITDSNMEMLRLTIKPAPMTAVTILLATALKESITHPAVLRSKFYIKKLYALNTLVGCTVISIFLIILSMVPHGNLNQSTNITNSELGQLWQQRIKPFYLINEYGQHLRKMRPKRYEILVEYTNSHDLENCSWTELQFLYKPFAINGSLPLAGPYLPRLDFKFYDDVASYSLYQQPQLKQLHTEPQWLYSLFYRLLDKEPSIQNLLGANEQVAPTYIRTLIYVFTYTDLQNGKYGYWTKKLLTNSVAYKKESPKIETTMKLMKILRNSKGKPSQNIPFGYLLNIIRFIVMQFDGSILLLIVISLLIGMTWKTNGSSMIRNNENTKKSQ